MSDLFERILSNVSVEDLTFDDITNDIVFGIHAMLESRGLSQKELAEKLGCSQAAVSKQLSGDANLTLKSIARLLTVLDAKMNVSIVDKNANQKSTVPDRDNFTDQDVECERLVSCYSSNSEKSPDISKGWTIISHDNDLTRGTYGTPIAA